MSDLIDRQAAIDAVLKISEDETAVHNGWVDPYYVMEMLKRLPSAQPEIIRCKDCKFFVSDMEWCEADDEHPASPDAFCSWAERRSDE